MWQQRSSGWRKGKPRAIFDPDTRVRKLQKGIGLSSALARPGKLRIAGEEEWRKVGSLVIGLGPLFGTGVEEAIDRRPATRKRKRSTRTKKREP